MCRCRPVVASGGDGFGAGEGDGGYPSVRIMRSTLHTILLDAGAEMGGMIAVKWGAKLSRIAEDEHGVTAYFDDGSTAHGDILIGADGMHSKVRQHVLGPQAPTPTFDGLCIVYGFLPALSAIAPSGADKFAFPAFMFTPSGVFIAMPIDPERKTLAWWVIDQSVNEKGSRLGDALFVDCGRKDVFRYYNIPMPDSVEQMVESEESGGEGAVSGMVIRRCVYV
ncbi:hypothetical protein B0H11DRAFT_2183261 [Mycena galericulata]|nr:hypothetical protein B0H11DRAFT_2183261 [Mycena galericulata]